MDYIKAEATSLFIGDIEFDAIRIIETGEYRFSSPQVLEPIGVDRTWFSTLGKRNGLRLKVLRDMGLTTLGKSGIFVSFSTQRGETRTESRSLAEADECWEYFAEKGNKEAKLILRALRQDSLLDRFEQVYCLPRTSVESRRQRDNRILVENKPYAALYKKDMCDTAFKWFGSQFYWDYFYCWMTNQERCDLDSRNPVINGSRKTKIHQWIESETKERLRDKAIELRALIVAARSREHFIELFRNSYGDGWQMSIFD